MADQIGQHLGQYRLVSLLGKGGMATVYRAWQESIERDVAIKVIRPDFADTEDFIKRFKREAKTIASLSHPHILKVFDYGEHEGTVYLVMELLAGGSLADPIRKAPLSPDTTSRLLEQIGSALDYAHQQGIVHRDLKPQNVLLDKNNNAVLTDFGIAKLLKQTTALTQSGVVLGTPAYMAPEQWNGLPIDARTDIYALGAMLFEMLTGAVPFNGDTPFRMMHMHIYEPPPSIQQQRPDLSPDVQQVIDKALSKDREQRYSSAGELSSAFKQTLAGTKPAPSKSKTSAKSGTEALPKKSAPLADGPTFVTAATAPPSIKEAKPAPKQTKNAPEPKAIPVPEPVAVPAPRPPDPAPALNSALPTPLKEKEKRKGKPQTATNPILALLVVGLIGSAVVFGPGVVKQLSPTPTATVVSLADLTGRITFESKREYQEHESIYVMNADGSNIKRITDTSLWVENPSWSPDGKRIAYNLLKQVDLGGDRPAYKASGIYIMNADGTSMKAVTDGFDSRPVWSPDGTTIAFYSVRDDDLGLYLVNTDGSNLRKLVGGVNPPLNDKPAWSPDSKTIAYTAGSDGIIYSVPADGSLLPGQLSHSDTRLKLPSWSPDGKMLAALSDPGGDIYVMNADGTNVRQVTENVYGYDYPPEWSPDSQHILFTSEYGFFVIDVNGSNLRQLTSGRFGDQAPDWVP